MTLSDRAAGALAVAFVTAVLLGLAAWVVTGEAPPLAERTGNTAADPPAAAEPAAPAPTGDPTPTPTGAGAAAAFAGVVWERLTYPESCGGLDVEVQDVEVGETTGDGRPEAFVAVRCAAGAGSPPSALYAFAPGQGPSREPRLVATLLAPDEDVLLTGVVVGPDGVTGTGTAYSSPDVPRCCPDRTFRARWSWDGVAYRRAG